MSGHPSIADIWEKDLVRQLLADRHWRSRLVELRGIPSDALIFQTVPLASLPGAGVGDVDILLCSPNRPDLATAIEVKRVKLGARAVNNGQPNKLQGFEKGMKQANRLASIGFSQVYLYVFVVVDSREQNLGQVSYAGPSSEVRNVIGSAISVGGLDPRVGLFQCEFVQPMDSVPLGVGTYHGHLFRLAQTVTQPAKLTQWVMTHVLPNTRMERADLR